MTYAMFQLTAPLQPSFHPVVFAQGFVRHAVLRLAGLVLAGAFPHPRARVGCWPGVQLGPLRHRPRRGAGEGCCSPPWAETTPASGAAVRLIYALGVPVIWWALETANGESEGLTMSRKSGGFVPAEVKWSWSRRSG